MAAIKEKPLPRSRLRKMIEEFLGRQGLCVLATCGGEKPRATPVEYFPDGLTLYILTEGGRKIANIRRNPEVSIALSTPWLGWDKSRGVQISGRAKIGEAGSAIFKEGVRAFRRRLGRKNALVPAVLRVIKIVPYEIDYLDLNLRAKGYSVRHVLKLRGRRI